LGGLIGGAIEKIGEFTGIDAISDVGEAIQDVCSGYSSNVGVESSYDRNTANVYSTEKLNELLMTFSEKSLKKSEELEKRCIQMVEDYCDTLIQVLKESSAIIKDTSNLKRVERNRSKIKRTIEGSVKNPLAKRMSLDDSECLRILKLDSGTEKKKQMEKFSKKVINEAFSNLSVRVRGVLNEQSEDIESFFLDYSESYEKKVWSAKKQYDDMLKTGKLEESDIERNCIEPLITIEAAQLVEGLL
jgi:hypothetical protein